MPAILSLRLDRLLSTSSDKQRFVLLERQAGLELESFSLVGHLGDSSAKHVVIDNYHWLPDNCAKMYPLVNSGS